MGTATKSRKPPGAFKTLAIAAGLLVLTGLGVMALQYGLKLQGETGRLAADGVEVTGTVTDMRIEAIGGGQGKTGATKQRLLHIVSYEFLDERGHPETGGQYVAPDLYATLGIGEAVAVRYLPEDHSVSSIGPEAVTRDGWSAIWAGVGCLVAVLSAAVMIANDYLVRTRGSGFM